MILKIHKYMKKKIIFFCPSIEVGGVEKNLFKIANFFSRKNEEVYIITFDQKNINNKFSKKIKIISVKFLSKLYLPYFIKVLFCILNILLNLDYRNLIFISFQSNLYFILLESLPRIRLLQDRMQH